MKEALTYLAPLAAGIVGLGLALIFAEAPWQIMQFLAQSRAIPQNLGFFGSFVENIFIEISRDVMRRWLIIDGLIALVGGGCILIGFVLRRLKRT